MTKTTPEPNAESVRSKKSLLRRAKRSERENARWLQTHDGPDHRYDNLTTSTGRIGHLTGLQADSVSRSYLSENKNVKVPATLAKWWQQIASKAIEWGKNPIITWEPSNGADYRVAGKPLPHLHIITPERHRELLEKERYADANGYRP